MLYEIDIKRHEIRRECLNHGFCFGMGFLMYKILNYTQNTLCFSGNTHF